MARVHRVDTSRKEHTCGRGGHIIPKGDGYYHASPGFRRRTPLIRCFAHPFRPSELTTSLASDAMAAREALDDALDAINPEDDTALDELEAAVEELRSEMEQYRDTRQEALDAWEHGNSQLEEYLETAETAMSVVDGMVINQESRDSFDTLEEWVEHVEAEIEEVRMAAEGMEF